MAESRLLGAVQTEVPVEYRQFRLQEEGGADALAVESVPDVTDDRVATGTEGGVMLWSAGNDHYARVRLELWSGIPPQSQQAWEIVQDDTFSVSATGRMDFMTVMSVESGTPIALPHLGGYRIRVHVRGREEAAARGEAEYYHDVEQWLLQIWPAGNASSPSALSG
jgi:hypothetical protein